MNILIKKFYKWQLNRLVLRMCGNRIQRIDESTASVNCFVITIDKDSKPYFLVKGIDGDNLTGFLWDNNSYSSEANIPVELIVANNLIISHYRGVEEIKYRGIWDFVLNQVTRWVYIKIFIDNLNQQRFKKKKLIIKERLDLLKFMVSDQFKRSHKGISILDLMTKLYTIQWIDHPESQTQEEKLELYLDSLVNSGDIQKINNEYMVIGKAISSIEKFEEEERRHVENWKMQRRILWLNIIIVMLTIIIALAALVQANVIKLPVLIDLTVKTIK
jgi:hypothetical protein